MPNIAAMRHRVQLCSQNDVITDGDMRVVREGVQAMWAKIEEKGASRFSKNGAAFGEAKDRRTHIIYTRYHADLNVSAFAWLYEARRKSAPRWFKVLRVGQTEMKGSQFFKFEVRLVERGDDLAQPATGGQESMDEWMREQTVEL